MKPLSEATDVRRLLRYLNDARELRKNALVGHLFEASSDRMSRAEANAAALVRVRALVRRALERLEPPPDGAARDEARARRLHAIISRCDIAGEKHESVARDLGLSPRQFYRERGAAFARFAEALGAELASGPSNLPWQPTSFIGRKRELAEIAELLRPRALVTIVGSGGTGKTRIAIEAAARWKPAPRDGVWFVDLAAVGEEMLVLRKIAAALDLRPPEPDDPLRSLAAAIGNRAMLVVLDNCEHVIAAVRAVAGAILGACPSVTLLATSRERLAIAGESVYPLSTLSFPTEPVTGAAHGRSYAALELFAERAAQHGVPLADAHYEAAGEICRRLDGVALAIELAAARLPVLGLGELRAQLAEHFRVIGGGGHDVPPRQQTLDATISWSYELLPEAHRIVFRRLAIFANGWTLAAATAVCSGADLPEDVVQAALLGLVEKSLAIVDHDAPVPRYSFYESTRAYAMDRLEAAGEGPELARRHAYWMADFADRAYDEALTMTRSRWGDAVEPDISNAFAALDWSLASGETVVAARIAVGLTGLWHVAGISGYGRRYVDAALAKIDAAEHPALTAGLLLGQSQFLHGIANADTLKRAIALAEPIGEKRLLARCYVYFAYTLARTGEYDRALEIGERAAALILEEGLQRSPLYARLLADRSIVLRAQGRTQEARAALSQALSFALAIEDEWSMSLCQTLLAEIEFTSGNVERAVALGEAAIASARRVHQESFFLCNLACYQIAAGDLDAAEATARETLELARSTPHVVQGVIQHLAAIAALRGEAVRAARLMGYVDAWYERMGCMRDATDQKGYELLVEALQARLGAHEIATLAAQGARLTEDAAVDEALYGSMREVSPFVGDLQ